MNPRVHPRPPLRRAILTLSVLVSLTIVAALFAGWVRTLVLERRQISAEFDRVQAELVSVSALDRAHARLQADPAYQGETWRVAAADGLSSDATVEIRVEPVEGQPQSRQVRIDARYPQQRSHAVREQREEMIVLPNRSQKP